MKILVTGGTGLLGVDLCRRLSRNHEVTGWARKIPDRGPAAAWDLESLDLADAEAVRKGMARLRPGAVVHCAGMADVDACERDPAGALRANAEMAGILASECARSSAVLTAVSTDYVFGGQSPHPYRETDPTGPVSVYGRSKLEGERLALGLTPRVLVIRVSGLFGSSRQNFVSFTAERLRAGEPVPAVTDQINSPSYTVDLAEGFARLIDLLEKDPASAGPGGDLHGVFHLVNRGGASRFEVAEEIARILGKPAELIRRRCWADLGRPARRPAQSRLDGSRFSERIGQCLRSWEEAVRDFLLNSNG